MKNIDEIKEHFPKIELSYDRINHKKVPNIYLAIPSGKKSFIWFTHYKGEDLCYLIETNKNFDIVKYKKISTFFNKQLSYGTVLHGTVVKIKKVSFFACENIFYYCGKKMSSEPFKIILDKMLHMFENNLNCIAYTNNEMIITSCITSNNKDDIIKKINDETYSIYGILCRNVNSTYSYMLPQNMMNDKRKYMNFRVMADIKYNVYNLYVYDNYNGIQFYQKTYIPDYKTSVMLNNKFRIIKENTNLDLLEESDDEDEFENIDEDKFVYLDRYYNFRCYYHLKSKRWIPFELTNDKHIANTSDLRNNLK